MRNIHCLALSAALAALSAAPAAAQPTTQACLGDFDAFLACPAGAERSGTECRAREPNRGRAAGEHWSGSKRQGPAIFTRASKQDPSKQRVSFAAYYKDHKKSGRVFHFDDDGKLSSWSDVVDNRYHGLSVSCTPDGRVYHLAYYDQDKVVGVSRSWRMSDGAFSYAMDHDAAGPAAPGRRRECPAAAPRSPVPSRTVRRAGQAHPVAFCPVASQCRAARCTGCAARCTGSASTLVTFG